MTTKNDQNLSFTVMRTIWWNVWTLKLNIPDVPKIEIRLKTIAVNTNDSEHVYKFGGFLSPLI